jgi:hypothetical protein
VLNIIIRHYVPDVELVLPFLGCGDDAGVSAARLLALVFIGLNSCGTFSSNFLLFPLLLLFGNTDLTDGEGLPASEISTFCNFLGVWELLCSCELLDVDNSVVSLERGGAENLRNT